MADPGHLTNLRSAGTTRTDCDHQYPWADKPATDTRKIGLYTRYKAIYPRCIGRRWQPVHHLRRRNQREDNLSIRQVPDGQETGSRWHDHYRLQQSLKSAMRLY